MRMRLSTGISTSSALTAKKSSTATSSGFRLGFANGQSRRSSFLRSTQCGQTVPPPRGNGLPHFGQRVRDTLGSAETVRPSLSARSSITAFWNARAWRISVRSSSAAAPSDSYSMDAQPTDCT